MKIIEEYTCSKSGIESKNEDLIYVNNDYCVLLDGATSKTKEKFNGKTAGQLTVDLIAKLFEEKIETEAEAGKVIDLIRNELIRYSQKNQFERKEIHLCASGLIYSCSKKQIWSVGDCKFLINGVFFDNHKRVDSVFGEMRSVLIRCYLQNGYSIDDLLEDDLARKMIMESLKMQTSLENTDDPYGYSVFSCLGNSPKIDIYNVVDGDEIIFASDGYPEVMNTLKKSEEKLEELIRQDPLMFQYVQMTKGVLKGNKSYDDRSYIRFIV